jgi:hypothetical protein
MSPKQRKPAELETQEPHADSALFCSEIEALMGQSADIYVQLNALRDWVNVHYPDFELYLEDMWNERTEGETHIEYILRSHKTLNETDVLGYDIYLNHRDDKGVWHLDDYVSSVFLLEDSRVLWDFIQANS